ncbi:TonB-dependent siderophore receptor [Pseudomonas juntendi]|uniref:TonB-dependent siderophore receptor n=1 Tax=Pseudomonas juntendi TaxID=2666183 RepID=UPI0007D78FC9|nr:TonB-dependent siderophore receptor [Pseudomonas juntendi]NOY01394.1 TonB-dependent siderophore receptor [Gammaproteobacteria bacterium]OAK65198.1 ligand-gated channel [Pseudomonas putida]PPB14351.1 TonB-dependent siderophore receptor [Pseudomonas aeruginosa]MCL8328171.1 TonB-dependent siderophore receptor [Pseudomonas juntendi]NPA17801.1 TonB-dependent siderophore receptor [Gammaproteobacteria bacterium]
MRVPSNHLRLQFVRHAICLTAGLALHNAAQASDTAVVAAAEPPATQQDKASWTLEPVIVKGQRTSYSEANSTSATRTDTPVKEVPQSVQIITRSLIEEQSSATLGDALLNVSGVRPTRPEETLFTQPIVRGFPAEIYMNGMPAFGGTAAYIDPTSMIGVERVEVLKGPTSTLYGGGLGAPLGGLINVVKKRPEAEPSAFLSMRTGSFDTVNPAIDLNTPINDNIAARLSAEYQKNDSWIDQVEGERWSIQPSIAFQLSPDTELLLRGQYDKRSQLEYSGLPAEQALRGQIDRDAFPGAGHGQPHTTVENRLSTAELTHHFNDNTRLTVTGQYYEMQARDYGSWALGAADPAAAPTTYSIYKLYLPGNIRESTLDANLAFNVDALGGQHELLVGATYDNTHFWSAMSGAEYVGELDLANPVYDLDYGTTPVLSAGSATTNDYRTSALYLQDQATYGRWHLLASLRFTSIDLKQEGVVGDIDKRYHRATPRLGVTYDLTESLALYVAYAEGFRGAFNFTGLEAPKPELSRNYEAGVKLAFTDIGLSGTLALFEQTRRNVATPDPDPANAVMGYSVQSGEQRARGFETDLTWEPTPAVSILANYAYTQAEVREDNTIPVGDGLPRVPKHSGRLAARYRILDGAAEGLSFGAGVTALSARELTLPNTVSVPGYALLDAQVSYDFDRYSVSLSGVNLTGREVFETYQYLGSPLVLPTQPRSAYVTLSARF